MIKQYNDFINNKARFGGKISMAYFTEPDFLVVIIPQLGNVKLVYCLFYVVMPTSYREYVTILSLHNLSNRLGLTYHGLKCVCECFDPLPLRYVFSACVFP